MKPAAIMASLVDVRNIAAHKCVRLEIHVPAEQAGIVLEAFGWPTMVNPVEVGIARLSPSKAASGHSVDVVEPPAKLRRTFSELPMSQQSALRCDDLQFRNFLRVHNFIAGNSDEAAEAVRNLIGVASRADILPETPAGRGWVELERKFAEWRLA